MHTNCAPAWVGASLNWCSHCGVNYYGYQHACWYVAPPRWWFQQHLGCGCQYVQAPIIIERLIERPAIVEKLVERPKPAATKEKWGW